MARVAHAMAMENTHVTADVVEVLEFPFLNQRYMITGVPKIVVNERVQFVGAVPESMFIDKVLEAAGLDPREQQPVLSVAPALGPSTRSLPQR